MSTTSRALTIATLVNLALSGDAAVAQETVPVFRPEIALSLTCHGAVDAFFFVNTLTPAMLSSDNAP